MNNSLEYPLIDATNLSHSYDYQLYSNIDFILNSKQSIAILGRSGSGKSTLLHNLSTFLPPLKGEIKILNKTIYNNEKYIDELRRFNIGIIFQSHYLFKGMKAIDNIKIATILSQEELDVKLLKKFEIDNIIEQKISELSGGQQQRVSIVRVLSKKPNIIFADEPTGNLDNETAHLVMTELLEYINKNNAGLIVVTHDESMAKMCDNIYKLENKKLMKLK
jgi:putative ABC transport system ATP-binding protein